MPLWRAAEHEPLSDHEWDEALAREAISTIVADAQAAERGGFWPGHPLDDVPESDRLCSIYLGSAGMIWALHRLGSRLDSAAKISDVLAHHRREPHPEELLAPSLMLGEVGILAVAAAVGSAAADLGRLRELVVESRSLPECELLYGSPGAMLAARAAGLTDEWRESARLLWASRDEDTGLWTQRLGGNVYLGIGPAHGFAGNVHVLRGSVSDDVLRARVTQTLERTAWREGDLVNWPPVPGPMSALADGVRVQWCHGAPGIVSTVGDLMPLGTALAAGELVWRAGPLRKGPGLCHGTAGNGYAFLELHELTADPLWLDRARRFAVHAVEQVRSRRAATGRGRYTLFTGDVGVALYLDACVRGDARFPILDWM